MVGNSLNPVENNVCGTPSILGDKFECNEIGRYLSMYKLVTWPGGAIMCMSELAAYSTIDIAHYSDIDFTGETEENLYK